LLVVVTCPSWQVSIEGSSNWEVRDCQAEAAGVCDQIVVIHVMTCHLTACCMSYQLAAVCAATASGASTAAEVAVANKAAVTPAVIAAAADMLPAGYQAVGPCLCVEIKPKAGFMPTGVHSAVPLTSIKRQYPRFMLHQLLKHLKVPESHDIMTECHGW